MKVSSSPAVADVLVFVRDLVRLAHGGGHGLVVGHQLAQHVVGGNERRVVVLEALALGDVADRAQRGAADLAHALGQFVGGGEDLVGLLVEQQVVVAEMRPADVPVEVLGLEVEREGIGEQAVESSRNLLHGAFGKIGGGVEGGGGLLHRFERPDLLVTEASPYHGRAVEDSVGLAEPGPNASGKRRFPATIPRGSAAVKNRCLSPAAAGLRPPLPR